MIERLSGIQAKKRFLVLYGTGIGDIYLDEGSRELNFEEALQQHLTGMGFSLILFYSTKRGVYSLPGTEHLLGLSSGGEKPVRLPEHMPEGPLGRRWVLQKNEIVENIPDYRKLTDLLEQSSDRSSVIFSHAARDYEFDDVFEKWINFPESNQSLIVLLFPLTRLAEVEQALIESKPILISNSDQIEYVRVNGPSRKELGRLVASVQQLTGLSFETHEFEQLTLKMQQEKLSLRNWIKRLFEVSELNMLHFQLPIQEEVIWKYEGKTPGQTRDTNLDSMIGLTQIKEKLKRIQALIRVQRLRQQEGFHSADPFYHMVFSGNPGTGKTTVARMMGLILKEAGLLEKGHMLEVEAHHLVAEHVGGTARETQRWIEKALDGVLFIDEAYTLIEKERGGFGQEALDALITAMETHRRRLVIILAGYPDKMQKLMHSNPGISRRIPPENLIQFEDYSIDELYIILEGMLAQRGLLWDKAMVNVLKDVVGDLWAQRDDRFGNAGAMRNLADGIEAEWALRIGQGALMLSEPLLPDDIPEIYRSVRKP
ncbi:MAG: AAA family ATPase [Anaerolineaceae bacterium]|nr:AAA family ATPase [Anaerolineaceae bacterium]